MLIGLGMLGYVFKTVWLTCSLQALQATKTQFIVVTPEGAVQAVVAIVSGEGRINVQPSAMAHGAITLVDTAGNAFQVCFLVPTQ
jgi:hypothetical protein